MLMLPLALSLTEPPREKLKAPSPFKDIMRIFWFSISHTKLRWFILYTALILSTGVTGVWAYFLYYESMEISIGYFGIIFAVFQLSSGFGSKIAHALEKKTGSKTSLSLPMLIALTFVLLGIFKAYVLIPLIFLNAFLWGLTFPLLMDYMNRFIKSEIRATVLSVANMAGSLSFVIISPLFGRLVDEFSLSTAFVLLGIYFFIYGIAVLMIIFKSLHEIKARESEEVSLNSSTKVKN